MFKINPRGKEKLVINKIVYMGTTVPDPVIKFTPKKNFDEAPSSDNGIVHQTPGDGLIEEIRVTDQRTTKCEHGVFWLNEYSHESECWQCEEAQKAAAQVEKEAKKLERVEMQQKIQLKRMESVIKLRDNHTPNFDQKDIIAYEEATITRLKMEIVEEERKTA